MICSENGYLSSFFFFISIKFAPQNERKPSGTKFSLLDYRVSHFARRSLRSRLSNKNRTELINQGLFFPRVSCVLPSNVRAFTFLSLFLASRSTSESRKNMLMCCKHQGRITFCFSAVPTNSPNLTSRDSP